MFQVLQETTRVGQLDTARTLLMFSEALEQAEAHWHGAASQFALAHAPRVSLRECDTHSYEYKLVLVNGDIVRFRIYALTVAHR